jgi:uncharacterized protein YoxC
VTTSDIFFIIAAVGIVLVIAVLIPALAQLKQTALKAEILLETINRDLQPFLHKATEVSEELHALSASINEKVEKSEQIINTVQQAGETLLSTASLVKEAVTPVIVQIAGISAGIAAFTNFFKKNQPSERRYFDE